MTSKSQPAFSFDLQPTLLGKLVELRPLRADEFETLYEVAKDPLIWEQHPEHDRWTREIFQLYFDGAIESGGAFAVLDRSSGKIIGSTRYCALDPVASEVEIGWTFLARAYWGGKYNGEMKQLMLDHAFRFVDQVVFVIGQDNIRSRTAVERIGARFLRATAETDGNRADRVIYGIDKEVWRGRRDSNPRPLP